MAAVPRQSDHWRTRGAWDANACYNPFAILKGNRWLLWCNRRKGPVEQTGLAMHQGEDLWLQN